MKKKDPHLNLIALTNKKRMAGLTNLKQLVEETKPCVDGLENVNVRISKIMEIISKNKNISNLVYLSIPELLTVAYTLLFLASFDLT